MSAIAVEHSRRGLTGVLPRAAARALLLPVGLAALWGFWEGYRWLGMRGHWTWPFTVNDTNMPHVSKIWHAFGQPLQPDGPALRHYLWHYALFTGKEALAGFLLGAVIGFLLAVILAHSNVLRRGLLPVAINTLRGLHSPEPRALELMHSYAAGRWKILWRLRVPASLPYVFSALKISATASVIGAIIGETPASLQGGLGYAIVNFNQYYSTQPANLWATIIACALLGIAFFLAVVVLERLILRRAPEHVAEFVSLIGPSGCGKSTLLRIIGDLTKPTAGSVQVNGKPAERARRDHEYGIVFQDAVLYDWRTVAKNISLPLELLRWGRGRRTARVKDMLDLVELTGFESHHPWQLSGGMQQRVSIARALSFSPSLLLMDEPFGALDEMTRERLNSELLRIWQETASTVVFVTHSIPEAVFLSTRVVVMSARPGRIAGLISVDLPQPRTSTTREEPHFFELVTQVREQLAAAGAPLGETQEPALVEESI